MIRRATANSQTADDPLGLYLRWSLPGRERWQTGVLQRRPDLARQFEAAARNERGILEVRANAATGRILLRYQPDAIETDTEVLVRTILTKLVKDQEAGASGQRKHSSQSGRGPRSTRRGKRECRECDGSQNGSAGAGPSDDELKAAELKAGTSLSAGHPLWRLFKRSRPNGLMVSLALAMSVLRVFVSFLPPLVVAEILTTVLSRNESRLFQFLPRRLGSRLLVLGIVCMAAILIDVILEFVDKRLWRQLARSIEHDLRTATFEHIQSLDMAFIDEQTSNSLLNVISEDTGSVHLFLEQRAESLIQKILTLSTGSLVLIVLSPTMGLAALLPLLVIVMSSRYFHPLIASRHEDVRTKYGKLSQLLANNLSGIATVKSFVSEFDEVERVSASGRELVEDHSRAFAASSSYQALVRVLVGASFTSAFLIGAFQAINGKMSTRVFTIINFLLTRLVRVPAGMDDDLDSYHKAITAVERILDLLETVPQIVDGVQPLPTENVQGRVIFSHVRFGYSKDQNVLEDLELNVAPGSHVAIVGGSGAGKSTVVKLVMRFYDVDGGSISIDGVDIRELSIRDLRGAIGYVSQDVYLFHGTVYENLIFGRTNASFDDVVQATQTANAYDFIIRLPLGFDTIVGERGQKLSSGQRQRLSIARALLKDAPILVLDEATSAVDNETEALVQQAIMRIFEGRTVISVAHRLSTVRNADCIYVIEGGRVREQGDHESLLRAGGIYASYWNLQAASRDGQISISTGSPS